MLNCVQRKATDSDKECGPDLGSSGRSRWYLCIASFLDYSIRFAMWPCFIFGNVKLLNRELTVDSGVSIRRQLSVRWNDVVQTMR
jgi:hypothetical protein